MATALRARLRAPLAILLSLALAITLPAIPAAHADAPGTGRVSGQLLDEATQEPVGLGTVELLRMTETGWASERVSDVIDGEFLVTDLAPGSYTMWFDAPAGSSYYTQHLGGDPDQPAADDPAATFLVRADRTVHRDFVAARRRDVTVHLSFRGAGLEPTTGQVALLRWSNEAAGWVEHAEELVEAGARDVVFGNVPVGRFAVRAEWEAPTDYPPQVAGGLLEPPRPDDADLTISLGRAAHVAHDAELFRGGRITARVTSPGGVEPVVEAARDGVSLHQVVSLAGEVELLLLPGAYHVSIGAGGSPAGGHARAFPDVPVTAGGETRLGQIDLTTPEGPYATLGLLIADHPRLGDVLETQESDVVPSYATRSYLWLRDGDPIPGATGSTYRVGFEDVLTELSVVVSVAAPGFETGHVMASTLTEVPAVPSQLTLVASRATQELGTSDPIVLTGTVTVPAGVPRDGDLEVFLDGRSAGRVPVQHGTGRFTVPADLPVGPHAVIATFHPQVTDGRILTSSAGPVELAVVAAPEVAVSSSTSLSRSRAKQVFRAKGQGRVRLTASVVLADGSVPAGEVVFRDGTRTLGRVRVAQGEASLLLKRAEPVGRLQVTAQFVPSQPGVVGSTSSAVAVRVVKAAAKVAGKLAKKRARAGKRAKYRIRVKVAGVARPTGRLVIQDRKKTVRTVRLKTKDKGRITVRLPKLSRGKHRIRVVYQGNATVKKKASKRVTVRVR